MSTHSAVPFGALLRGVRLAAGLSQEELAERTGLSGVAISNLERGASRRPHPATVRLLAAALALDVAGQAALLAAARPEQTTPASPPAAPSTPLPSGMLAVLVTDVRGYTAFTHAHGDAAGAALATRFAELAGEATSAEGGTVVEVRGDETLAVFTSARAALRAAARLLARCAEESTPALPLRAGAGLDVGEPVAVPGGYRGEVINVAARLCAQAGPGEVLASDAVVKLARRVEGLAYQERGELSLKGLPRPMRVWLVRAGPPDPEQVDAASTAPAAPAIAQRHNLPATLSTFIGRERERARVNLLLASHRLVTLIGAGGVGKTRLALAVAEDRLASYPDGAWLVELAPLADPALVPAATAQALGVREEVGRPLPETLSAHLRDRSLLLVLDNCEHLIAASAALASTLLRTCPGLAVLATSQEALGVAGEQRYRVPSLSAPDPRQLPDGELAVAYDAVQLFVRRAQERHADFALTEANARAVAEVCARLDGVPLAIELAAARAGSLGVATIAARLDARLDLLTGGVRTAPGRHRTLRAALDWSWDLLEEPEQALLRRLSVFAGGWSLDAAEMVCAGAGDVLDALEGLVNRSLVQMDEGVEPARYSLQETVREYATGRLAASTEGDAVRGRHLAYFLGLAEEAGPRLTGSEQAIWLDRLEREHDNLRWALRRAAAGDGDQAFGLRLAGALWRFWYVRGYLSEGRSWLEQLLRLVPGDAASAAARALALHGASVLAWTQGETGAALPLAEQGLALRRELGDAPGIAQSLNALGLIAIDQGALERAGALLEESRAVRERLGDTWGLALALNNLGIVARQQGAYERASVLHREGLALQRARGDQDGSAITLANLGLVARLRGSHAEAAALYREALGLYRAVGDRAGQALCLEGLAAATLAAGDAPRAARLLGVATALRAQTGAAGGLAHQAAADDDVYGAVRGALGADFDGAWSAGRALPLDAAVASALQEPA